MKKSVGIGFCTDLDKRTLHHSNSLLGEEGIDLALAAADACKGSFLGGVLELLSPQLHRVTRSIWTYTVATCYRCCMLHNESHHESEDASSSSKWEEEGEGRGRRRKKEEEHWWELYSRLHSLLFQMKKMGLQEVVRLTWEGEGSKGMDVCVM